MTTGSAAKAGHSGEKEKDKEKTGIRRALGRGLESLLPGPRVVAAPRPAVAPVHSSVAGQTAGDTGTRAGVPSTVAQGRSAPHLQGGGAGGEQQVPPLRDAQGRNDRELSEGTESGEVVGGIQAVVEDEAGASTGESPLLAKDARNGAPGADPGAAVEVELRSAWTGEAPVPTQSIPTQIPAQSIPSQASSPQSNSTQSISTRDGGITIQAVAEPRTASNLVVQIPLDHIDSNPYQTRSLFDQEMLGELAESIRANGVVQPVVVRPGENGRYVLILGERRCRASKLAGKASIPAIVRRVSDQQAAEMTIIENLQREDLNCMEQAKAFRVLSQEFRLTQEQIGQRVGLSRESVSNYMRLLRLPQTVMDYLANNALTFSEARELMMLSDDKLIARAADIAVKKHLSIEKIEDLVMEMQGLGPIRPPEKGHGARWVDPNVKAAQSDLERLLGVRVRIRDRRGHGKIVIEYSTVDDYERVVEALRGKR